MPVFAHPNNPDLNPLLHINKRVNQQIKKGVALSGMWAKSEKDTKSYEKIVDELNTLIAELSKFQASYLNSLSKTVSPHGRPLGFGKIFELIRHAKRSVSKYNFSLLNSKDIDELQTIQQELNDFFNNYQGLVSAVDETQKAIQHEIDNIYDQQNSPHTDSESLHDSREAIKILRKQEENVVASTNLANVFFKDLNELVLILSSKISMFSANPMNITPEILAVEKEAVPAQILGAGFYHVPQDVYGMRKYN